MVQSLKDLIELKECDEASLREAFSLFRCAHCKEEDEESNDVLDFLQNHAIEREKEDTTRTYLIVNDDAWEEKKIQIDGFFSIALKVVYFHDNGKDVVGDIFNDSSKKNCPAFLIGQLARSEHTQSGAGAEYLNIALGYIAAVSKIIGGRLVYLDCDPERFNYYKEHGFSFLQQKKNSSMIQMYKVL